MTSLTRWKLACGLLTIVALVLAVERRDGAPSEAAHARGRTGEVPLVVRAGSPGSSDELARRLRTARTVAEVEGLAVQLGVIGDDRAIDAVRPLVMDLRPGVPTAILRAFGAIGTDHAVEVLAEHCRDARVEVHEAAIVALGTSHNAAAEPILVELAQQVEPETAVAALGELGTDHGVELLFELATTAGETTAGAAITALAASRAPAAAAALRRVIDSPSIAIATSALEAVTTIDDPMFAKLTSIIDGGELALVEPALGALAHAGERGLPILREAALHGTEPLRLCAISALASLRSPEALRTLGTILDTGDRGDAQAAAQALAETGTDEARELLISSALSDRRNATGAIDALLTMTGDDVEEALLSLAKTDRRHRSKLLGHLLAVGNADATALATELASHGTDAERIEAFGVFTSAGTPAAIQTLVALVRAEHGELRVEAIGLLARSRPGDPEVVRLLTDSLHAGDPAEARAAAAALGTAGTAEARDALIAALARGDDDLAETAMLSLKRFRLTPDVSAALAAAVRAHPALATAVMRRLVGEGSPAGLELARTALAGPGPAATAAVEALQRAGTPAAIDLIQHTLSSSDPELRRAAIGALGALRSGDSTDAVIAALRDGDTGVREAAIEALGALGTDQARAALLELTRSSRSEDRQASVASLQDVDDPAVGQAITQLIRDPDPDVAVAAIGAAVERGSDVNAELSSLVNNRSALPAVRLSAAANLRDAGVELDPQLEAELDELDPDRPGQYHMRPGGSSGSE